jgi:exodeoxyribonuclease VII large subunit
VRQVLAGWITREQHHLDQLRARPALADPGSGLAMRHDEVLALRERGRRTLHHRLDRASDDLDHQLARVRSMSPLATLKRGYAVVQDAEGHVLTSVDGTASDAPLQVRLADGRLDVTVTGLQRAELSGPDSAPTDPPPDHPSETSARKQR